MPEAHPFAELGHRCLRGLRAARWPETPFWTWGAARASPAGSGRATRPVYKPGCKTAFPSTTRGSATFAAALPVAVTSSCRSRIREDNMGVITSADVRCLVWPHPHVTPPVTAGYRSPLPSSVRVDVLEEVRALVPLDRLLVGSLHVRLAGLATSRAVAGIAGQECTSGACVLSPGVLEYSSWRLGWGLIRGAIWRLALGSLVKGTLNLRQPRLQKGGQ